MSKLLHKPLKVFSLYALLIFICSIPFYYYIVDAIWMEELDEHNQIVREQIQNGCDKLEQSEAELEKNIEFLKQIQPGILISPASSRGKDSVYVAERSTQQNGEMDTDRVRGLQSSIQIRNKPYRLTIETNVEEADETIWSISVITGFFITLLIIGFIVLNRRLSKDIWRPFTATLEQLKKFDLTDAAPVNFAKTDIIEFAELNEVLSKWISNSIQVYNRQKEFVQNASHELQTPLALLQSKIDLLIQDDSLTEQQRQIIESLAESVSRINRLNKNLLLLAGIEHRTYPSAKIEVAEVLHSQISVFKSLVTDDTKIEESISKEIFVEANDSLMEIMIANLLSNAVRHSDGKGNITVVLTGRLLMVKNTGKEPLCVDTLFTRFQSATSKNSGSGLGLSIVKEICHKYNWIISYQFEKEEHIFSIAF